MLSIAKLYALTSVTLRGTVMLIPALEFESNTYPFDLHIVLPDFLFAKNKVDPFLKFLHFVNFHYSGKLTISSLIQIETNSLLDELHKVYLRSWKENSQIAEVPERRRIVEQGIIKWSMELPKTPLSEFIYQYYSVSIKNTDWQRKKILWRSLRHKKAKKKELSSSELNKLKEKYVKIWFKYLDKVDFTSKIHSKLPEFIKSMNQLTFKDILLDIHLRICPACETNLSDYPTDIRFCAQCGYELVESTQKYCANCGTEVREGTFFCTNCGKKIEN
ncbi:MAG: zinc ribbon domain-containing protein [Candidatus Helarchaeota archaeon]|nr:zinc ribbon domain-containing protein [Candidatus Helarchaeota archaeon]